MQINLAISEEAKEHIALLRSDLDMSAALLIFGRFDFESSDYYNLAFLDEHQISSSWSFFTVGDLRIYIDKPELVEALSGKRIVIRNGELSFE